jgi:hypothetical protein
MKKFLHNVAERIKSMHQGRTETLYEIAWGEEAVKVKWLTMENVAGCVSFSWQEVLAVDTFKRDYFTVDCTCLAFQIPEGWIEVHEEMKGWADFLAAIESHLSGFPPKENWLRKVMIPAFEMNHARLWTKGQNRAMPANANGSN